MRCERLQTQFLATYVLSRSLYYPLYAFGIPKYTIIFDYLGSVPRGPEDDLKESRNM